MELICTAPMLASIKNERMASPMTWNNFWAPLCGINYDDDELSVSPRTILVIAFPSRFRAILRRDQYQNLPLGQYKRQKQASRRDLTNHQTILDIRRIVRFVEVRGMGHSTGGSN